MAVYGTNIDINVIGNAVQELQKIQAEYMSLQHDPGKTIKIDADDQVSQKAEKIKRSANSVPKHHNTKFTATGIETMNARMKTTSEGFDHLSKGAAGIRRALGLMATAGVAAFTALGAAAAKGAKDAVELQSSYKTTQNLIVTGGEKAKTAISAVNQMQRDGKKYSLEYGVSQQKIADAYQDLIKRGHTSAEALGVMKSELQASVASGDDFSDVVRVSSNTIEEFGMKTNNTAKMMRNTKKVVNDLAYASDATATDFRSMGVAMEYVGSSAHQAGVSLRETSALIGILSNNGLEADKAGTSLQEVLQHITKITPQGQKALEGLGLSVDDFKTKSGKLKSIPDIFSMINKGMDKAGIKGADRLKTMNQIFGTVGGNAANILASNTKQVRQLEDELKKAEQDDYVSKLAKKNSATVQMEMARAKTSLEAVTMEIGQAVMPAIAQVSEALAKGLTTKQAQREIHAISKELANFGNTVAKYLVAHGKDLWDIAESLGKIGMAIGEGAVKTIGEFFSILTGHPLAGAGDTTHRIAKSLTEIAKLTPLFKTLGAVFATYFLASKLMASAKAINEMYKGMLMISTLGKKKSLTGSLLGDLANKRAGGAMTESLVKSTAKDAGKTAKQGIQIAPYLDEKGFKASWSRFTRRLPGMGKEAGKTAGAATSKGLIGRLTSAGGARFLAIGKGIAGRLASGISIALGAVDILRGLTGSHIHNRAKMIGKGVGTIAGTAAGMALTPVLGPFGPILGSMLGGAIGGKLGPTLGKAGKGAKRLLKDIFSGNWGDIWKALKSGFQNMWKGLTKWASDTWKKVKDWWNNDDESSSSSSSHKSSSHKSKQPSEKEIKSLGGNHYSKTDIANIKQMNAAVKAYTQTLKRLKAVTKKNDPTKQLRNMSKGFKDINPRVKNSAKYWKALVKPLQTSSKALQLFDKSLKSFKGKTNPLDRLNRSVERLTKTVRRYQFGKKIAQQMTIADKSMSGKHSFVSRFLSMTKSIEKELRSFGKTFDKNWKDSWKNIDRYPNQGMSKAYRVVERDLERIISREDSFTSRFLSGWRSWIGDVVSAMRSGFNKLPGIAQRSMADIVSRLNRGISGINSVISDFGGDKQLSTIRYARGTVFNGGHPGGLAMINDGNGYHKQELVWQPSQGWKTFSGTNRIVTLEPGSQVIPAGPSHRALSALSIPHYASGTLSDEQQDEIAEQFMDNPIQASKNLILKLTDWNSSTPIIPSLGKASAIGFSRGIANVLKDLLGIIKEPINGDWTPVIKSAFRVLHLHAQGWQISKLLRQIQTESGGNEGAIGGTDGLSDGRATGLFQFKPRTFAHWADPRYHNIMKGFDQLVAAVRCLNAGGEGGWGNIGNGHGWANGGHITQAEYALIGEDGDEYVINPNKPNALRLVNEAMRSIVKRNPNLSFNRPKIAQSQYQPVSRQFSEQGNNNLMINLVKTAIDKLDNINIHPVVRVEDVRRPINNLNAMDYSRVRN